MSGSKAQRLAAAIGGLLNNTIGAVTLSAGTTAEVDLTGAGVLPLGAYRLIADIDCYVLQGATGAVPVPTIATVGAPGSSNLICGFVPAKTPIDILVNGPADQFLRATAAGAGVLRWYSRLKTQPTS